MGVRKLLSNSALSAFAGVALSGCGSSVYYMDDLRPIMPVGPVLNEPVRTVAPSFGYNAPRVSPTPTSRYVDYHGVEAAGTILVNLQQRKLYYVEGNGMAIEYPIAVGRQGSMGIGNNYTITRKATWPNWYPTQSMRDKNPDLPKMVAGGPESPLGAAALYLGNSLYRIHGTNDESSIGTAASSGCIRMYNRDIQDLYARANTGAAVRINTYDSFTPGISGPVSYGQPVLISRAPF